MGNTLYELNKKVEYLYCKMKSCGQEDPSLPFGEWTQVPLGNGVSLYYGFERSEEEKFNLAGPSLTVPNQPRLVIIFTMSKEDLTTYDWTNQDQPYPEILYFNYSFQDDDFNLPYAWMGEDFEENGLNSSRMLYLMINETFQGPVIVKDKLEETTVIKEAKAMQVPPNNGINELNISFTETESGFKHDFKLIITP